MTNKKPSNINTAKKTAILNELETVKDLFESTKTSKESTLVTQSPISKSRPQLSSKANSRPKFSESSTDNDFFNTSQSNIHFEENALHDETPSTSAQSSAESSEFQIPLLDTAHPNSSESSQKHDIPTIDDISSSSSLFSEQADDDAPQSVYDQVAIKNDLQGHAQLIIQDLLNEALSELEEKFDDLLPKLEERLKKRLEKAMNDKIETLIKD